MATCTSRDGTNSRTAIYDRTYKSGGRGIIGIPGVDGTDWPIDTATDPTVVAEGWPKMQIASGQLWGNATHQTRITDARTALIASPGAINGKVYLSAGSMGAAAALNWAKANPTLVQAISLAIPAIDLQDIHANNRGSYAAQIAAAWGGGAPADANNPADNAASFTSIPIKIWYSTDDPVCTAATVTAFASAAGATAVSLGAQGHSAAGIPTADVIDFYADNA